MDEKANRLQVQMLGGFSLLYDGKAIQVGRSSATKALHLLQALLYVGKEGLSRQQLFERLYGYDSDKDIANNLRVTVYNLRKLLQTSGLPKGNYVTFEDGRYRFDCPVPVEVDALEFDRLIHESERESGDACMDLLRRASSLYRGHFLPALSGEEWVVVAGALYQGMYFNAVEKLCRMLSERKLFDELLEVSSRAAALYPFDEWQVWQINALLSLGRPKEAMELYESVTAMYFDELATPPSERMLGCFQRMSNKIQINVNDLYEIQSRLREADSAPGAYFCAYPSFVDIYRTVCRVMERSGQSVYLMVCTLEDERGKLYENPDRLKELSEKLFDSIRLSLRRGDVFTRCNLSQCLIILMGIKKEECPIVTRRIDQLFRQKESNRRYVLQYRMASVANLIGSDSAEIHFTQRGATAQF